MSDIQKSRLVELEARIASGLQTFYEVGKALTEIRDDRLYKDTHGTFEDYCKERWGMSRPRAYEYIGAAKTTKLLSARADKKPKHEKQVRHLSSLSDDDKVAVWKRATENTDSPTEQQIKELVARHKEEQAKLEVVQLDIIDNNIILGDCLEMDWPECDLVLTDPPYGLSRDGQAGVRAGKGDWDELSYAELHTFNKAWLSKASQSLNGSGSLMVFGSLHNMFSLGHLLKEMGFYIISHIVWVKPYIQRAVNPKSLAPAHENILWARPGKRHTSNLYEVTRDVWEIPPRRDYGHPTEKPEELIRRLLVMASKPGDTIVDPFLGSGTTAAIALQEKRDFWGVEKEQQWWDIAQQRVGDIGA